MDKIISTKEYERRMVFARQRAAQAWCTDNIKETIMDPILAEEFAKILVDEMYETHLGCATTGELLDEVKARVDCDYSTIESVY